MSASISERVFDRMKTAPNVWRNTRRGLTQQIGISDWRAVMDSIQEQSGGFRTPDRCNSVPVPERVALRAFTNVDKLDDGCWISRYSVASHGYAQIGWSIPGCSRADKKRTHMVLAHRAAWTHVNGQVPLGMTLDHTCKVRRCVNPAHLRLLPNYENARRVHGMDWPIGYCANGHPSNRLIPAGTKRRRSGRLQTITMCADCKSLYAARGNWRARKGDQPMPDQLLLASEKGTRS